MHFQGMFLGVGGVEHLNLRQIGNQRRRVLVDLDRAQRRFEGVRPRQRQAVDRDPVTGAQQHDPLDPCVGGFDPGVSAGRDGAGIHVSRVGRDDRLGHGADGDLGVVPAPGKHGLKLGRTAGIEGVGDGGGADGTGSADGHWRSPGCMTT